MTDLYELCADCDHFIEPNASEPFFVDGRNIIADFDHLDDGDKEHDHDAYPSDAGARNLAVWRALYPSLFAVGDLGKIGPNRAEHQRVAR